MANGKVKWFNNAKGYGFILPDDGGDDLFAHYSSIEMEGYKTLKAGQDVIFEVLEGPKGLHATQIQAIGEPETEGDVTSESQGSEDSGGVSSELADEVAERPTSEVISVTVEGGVDGVGLPSDAGSDEIEPSKARHSN